jgi:hypothetical protein
VIAIPAGSRHFQTAVDMTYNGQTFQVEIEVGLHSATGEVFAHFQAIDPETGLPPDVLTGFLPPEDGTGRGMGYFSYVIRPEPGLPTGTAIRNVARIIFDGGEIIDTNQVDPHDPAKGTDLAKEALTTIDAGVPTSSARGSAGGHGSAGVSVSCPAAMTPTAGHRDLRRVRSGRRRGLHALAGGTAQTDAAYGGAIGHSYAFYSVATDTSATARRRRPTARRPPGWWHHPCRRPLPQPAPSTDQRPALHAAPGQESEVGGAGDVQQRLAAARARRAVPEPGVQDLGDAARPQRRRHL